MPLFSARLIYTPQGFLTDHVLETDSQGCVLALRPRRSGENVKVHEGILCPGFVNAHCHLELSALHGLIPQHSGMVDFVQTVVQKRRAISEREQQEAARQAMAALHATGTVAVGDICNSPLTAALKRELLPELYTHSFIELLGLVPEKADQIWQQGQQLFNQFSGLSASITSHAPYSVSPALARMINQSGSPLLSIHLLESKAERRLFLHGDGPFPDFFHKLGISRFSYGKADPIAHITRHLSMEQAVIFIHLTEATSADLARLARSFPKAYFCLCPRSNQYIHQRLPDLTLFQPYAGRLCLGTDSLASNHDLNMLEEIRVLARHFPATALHTLLRWATTQGAEALQLQDKFGIFAPGTRCGVNLISGITLDPPGLTENSRLIRLS